MSADPPDDDGQDGLDEAKESECDVYGHEYEGNDEVSERCWICGNVREYTASDRSRRVAVPADDIHVCWTAADHVFGGSVCMYCGQPERELTQAERDAYAANRRARREASGAAEDAQLFDD